MALSIHTNSGASVALQSLNSINSRLNSVQNQVSTGYKVSSSKDDAAAFSVAQGVRGDISAIGAVEERLGVAAGAVEVATAAATAISETVIEMKAVVTKLSDSALSAAEKTQYEADLKALATEVNNFVGESTFGSADLLGASTAADLTTLSNITVTKQALTGQDIIDEFGESTPDVPAQVDALETNVNKALANLGQGARAIENQMNFLSKVSDANETALGAIVDADMAKASAELQALQIQQQLATSALSIANQSPSNILGLFQ